MTPKALSITAHIDKWNFIKIKNCYFLKDIANGMKEESQNGGKDLQVIYLIKDWYPEYVKTHNLRKYLLK